jgi:transposase
MQKLSKYQRVVLLKNQNVEKIGTRNVIYKSRFKINAVEKYLKGWKPDEIFKDAGINPSYFIKNYSRSCIKRWKKKYFEDGKASLGASQTGKKASGRPRSKKADDLTVEELRAIVEIQEEVIDMLKKNRALAKKNDVN